jgi:hypothetical protein
MSEIFSPIRPSQPSRACWVYAWCRVCMRAEQQTIVRLFKTAGSVHNKAACTGSCNAPKAIQLRDCAVRCQLRSCPLTDHKSA